MMPVDADAGAETSVTNWNGSVKRQCWLHGPIWIAVPLDKFSVESDCEEWEANERS